MKIRNSFLGRFFAGLLVTVVVSTGIPGAVFAEETETVETIETFDKTEEEETFDFEEWTSSLQDALPTANSETSAYSPYAKIRYGYSETVTPGTIRWITQNKNSSWYDYRYWKNWQYAASYECGTTCQSMALSYIGINETPYSLLTKENGLTRFTKIYASGMTVKYGNGYTSQSEFTANLQSSINHYLRTSDYSPVIIHLNNYPKAGGGVTSHYIIIVGKKSAGVYQTLDPWDNGVTEIKLDGRTVTYTLGKTTKTENIDEFYAYRNTKISAVVNPDAPDPDPEPEPEGEKISPCSSISGTVIANRVNVRGNAATTSTILGTVNYYDKVTITGKSENWYRVKLSLSGSKKTGYVYKDYVAESSRPTTVSFSVKQRYNNRMLITWTKQSGVSGYVVERYNSAKKKYEVIHRVTGSKTTSYTDKNLVNGRNYRYRVLAYKTVKGTNLYSPNPASISKAAKKYITGKVTESKVNIRKGPGTSYKSWKVVSKGTKVSVYGKTGDWYKVKFSYKKGTYKYGYIREDLMKL